VSPHKTEIVHESALLLARAQALFGASLVTSASISVIVYHYGATPEESEIRKAIQEALRACIGDSDADMNAGCGDITLTFMGGEKVTFWTSEYGGMTPAVLTEGKS
jgi:hypothetical protein